jgi:hypothetical protein
LDARSGVANVGGSAIDGNILASNSGGIHNSTQISGTGIAIIAVTRLATALTITITSIAPIKVSTVDFKGGSQLEFRQDSVTFAIEKVESVIVSRSKTISSGNSIEWEGSTLFGVGSSKIEDQLIVDKYPQIIISQKGEGLSSFVGEPSVNIHTKVEIVIFAITTSVGIGVILIGTCGNIETKTIHGEVIEVVVWVDIGRSC